MNPDSFFKQQKYFFFKDRSAAANYVLKNCKEELEQVIHIADDTVNQKFMFDLRWDMEKTYEPIVFPDTINWMYQPADDPEWIFAFNRMRYWICLGQAYAVTLDEKYASCFASQLCHWIKNIKRSNPEHAKAWRTIEAGLRLEYWLKAMCYFEGSPAITDEVMELFLGSIVDHADFLQSVYNSFNYMSNWGVLANHGLFLAGAMLPETDEKAKLRNNEYVATSLDRLSQMMSVQIYNDGMEWEQSPMYHNEVCHDLLDVVLIAHRNNIVLPHPIEEKVKAMCYADLYMQKPNGHELSMGDSDDIDQRDIVTKGAYIFKDSVLKSGGYEFFDFDCLWDLGIEAIPEYQSCVSIFPKKLTNVLEESGNICFRTSWTTDSLFFHFQCGTLGAGHGHSDKLHMDLFANGEDILIDSGRYTYVDKPERYEFKDSQAHNTTTVDNTSFYTCIDSWGCSTLNKAINFRCKDIGPYAYCSGGHLGYLLGGDKNVYVSREIIFIKPDIFILSDSFYTNESHSYEQYFHFNNHGTVKKIEDTMNSKNCNDNAYNASNLTMQQVEYKSKNNTVEFITIGKNIVSELNEGRISRHYNEAKKAPVLKTQWNCDGFSSVLTVISLNGEKVSVKKVPVLSNFKNAVFPDNMIEALEIEKGHRSYTVVCAHQEYASPTDTYCAGGITWNELEEKGIPVWKPGNLMNNGVATLWGAINSQQGCSGFGQITVFDRSDGSDDRRDDGSFRTGKTLVV